MGSSIHLRYNTDEMNLQDFYSRYPHVRIESLIGLLWIFVHHSFTKQIANKALSTDNACRRGGMLLCFPQLSDWVTAVVSTQPQTNWTCS